MEDDIDIEEHDVLEHPRIRTIFPDLTRIKQEIPDDYHDPDSQMQYQPYCEAEDSRHHQEDTSEYTRYGSKIILGSKPASSVQVGGHNQNGESTRIFGGKPVQIKQEVEVFFEEPEEHHHREEGEPNQASTCIILGSKPSVSGVIEPMAIDDAIDHDSEAVNTKTVFLGQEVYLNCDDDDNIETDPKDPTTAYVSVENWGPRLDNSSCYCKECLILFPTRNTLLAHNMTAHSFLVAVDKNRAVKSTAKTKTVNDSGKFCNHCNKMFPDSDSLINHLYEKLTFDKNNGLFKPKPQPNKVVPNALSKILLPKPDNEKLGEEKQVNAQGAGELFQCEVCSYYCEIYGVYNRHMNNNHSKYTFSKEKVFFDGQCRLCDSKLSSKLGYNKHIHYIHPKMFTYKGGPLPKPKIVKKPVLKNPVQIKPSQIHNRLSPYQLVNNSKYQCQKCSEIFMKYELARQHRKLKHPELAAQNILKRITNLSNKGISIQKTSFGPKGTLKRPKLKVKPQIPQPEIVPSTSKSPLKHDLDSLAKPRNQIVVPKSVLFKCNKCQMHFTSCTATVLHSKSCDKQKADWKCNICGREFRSFDQTVHRRQHQIANKFKVITYHDNIYGRILNQCPNCKLYFHEKDFYLHDQKAFCKGVAVKCEYCMLPIHPSSVETHSKWHERIDTNKKNVIVVEFASLAIENKTPTPVKRQLSFNDQATPAKKQKTEESKSIKVYYCSICGLFSMRLKRKSEHLDGSCRNENKKKLVCKLCGLIYSSWSHMKYHTDHPEVTLMDMKFVSLQERKVIAPPIPTFPRCDKCEVHFCKQETVATHNCTDSYKTCSNCKKRFSDLAFKLHMRFHDYLAKFKAKPTSVPNGSKTPDPLSELIKKYEMLPNTWNILFCCATCDIVCDSYDRAVEHCQNHFNNLESYDMVVEHCATCDLKFDGSCFERHTELHAQNKNIKKNSFKIVTYKYSNLLSTYWLKPFKSLPKIQMQQILSRSIYRQARNVKLRVVRQGAPEAVLYKCAQCDNYIHPLTLMTHYRAVSCKQEVSKIRCKQCNITFNSPPALIYHNKLHTMSKPFTIVYFNEDGDEEFNKNLRDNDRYPNHALGPTRGRGLAKRYHYNMCSKCKCCSIRNSNHLHNCPDPKHIIQCNLCQLHFHNAVITKHLKLHKLNPRFTRKNIAITQFRVKSGGSKIEYEEEKAAVKLYKCQCGLHFTSTKATEKHFEVCGTDADIAKENCSKCDRLFDTTQLVTHLCKHHRRRDESTEFEIIDVSPDDKPNIQGTATAKATAKTGSEWLADKRKDLFKCTKCDVYYLSAGALNYHFETNHQLSKVIPCPHCKLRFMPLTLKKHIALQHQLHKYKEKDFNIHVGVFKDGVTRIIYNDSKVAEPVRSRVKNSPESTARLDSKDMSILRVHRDVNLKNYNNNLYKCRTCSAYFLTWASLSSHKYECNYRSTVFPCPDCDYTFSKFSLLRHRYIHHQVMKLRREDIQIKYVEDKDVKRDSNVEETMSKESAEDSQCSIDTAEEVSEVEEGTSSALDTVSHLTDDTDDRAMTPREENKDKNIFKMSSILYKCSLCEYTFVSINCDVHVKGHSTGNEAASLHPCFCGLSFTRNTLARHQWLHHEKYNLTRDELYVITLELHGDIVGCKVLFRCETCQVYFTKLPNLENHLSLVEHNVQKRECPHCGWWFAYSTLERHIQLHHENMKLKEEDFIIFESVGKNELKLLTPREDKYKATLHKCSSCDTHYLDVSNFNAHREICKQDNNETAVCEQCQLMFSKDDLEAHVETHHENMNLKADDFNIINYGSSDNAVTDDELASNMSTEHNDSYTMNVINDSSEYKTLNNMLIYQCDKCKRCMMQHKNIRKHYTECDGDEKLIQCDKCPLKFRLNSILKTHKKLHHAYRTKLKDLVVINYTGGFKRTQGKKESLPLNKLQEIPENVSTLDDDLYTNQLYKCDTCAIHFLLEESLKLHTQHPEVAISKSTCTFCGFAFAVNTLPTHVFIHHEKMNLSAEHFIVNSKEENMAKEDSNMLIDSISSADSEEIELTSKNILSSAKEDEEAIVADSGCVEEKESDVNDVIDIDTSKDDDVSIVTPADSLDKNVVPENDIDVPSSSKDDKDSEKANKIKLYKCAGCNVCFLSQTSCYKHVTKHVPLDPKDYIECKLCKYQFLILNNSLHKHITKHHRISFKPEDVLIEEYNPNVLCHGTPKIDIYFGTDKVQSKLISTTSEANVSSEFSEESDKEVKTTDNSIVDLDSSDMGTISLIDS